MAERDNEIVGLLITLFAWIAWNSGYFNASVLSGFSKGESLIFLVIIGFILVWSVVHAACFLLDLFASIAAWCWKTFVVDRVETLKFLNLCKRKVNAIISAAISG